MFGSNHIKTLFLLACLATSSLFALSQDLPPPYDTAEILPFLDQGLYPNASRLKAQIRKRKVKTIIEVGSFLGGSTRHMASCLPEDGVIYAVDHWKGSTEHQYGQGFWIPELERLYEYFLSNTIQAGLSHKIVPIRMESLAAAAQLQVQADLIYIDAAHDTESVYNDLVAWYPHLNKEGLLCGDDWTWSTVRTAVIRFAKEHKFRLKASGNFWRFEKTKYSH